MKLAAVSDLHVDECGFEETLHCLADELKVRGSRVLLIPGDISEHYTVSLRFVRELRERAGIPVYWVAGNHETWNKRCPGMTAPQILAELARDEGYVAGSVPLAPGWTLVGHWGWYDYSLGDLQFAYEELQQKRHMGRTWQDSLYADFGESDALVHDKAIHLLRRELAKAEEKGNRVVLMTHMISHRAFAVPPEDPRPQWRYFNAFLGSRALFCLAREPVVGVAVCGHVHYRKQVEEENARYFCCCLGTPKEFPYYGSENLAENLRQALVDILL